MDIIDNNINNKIKNDYDFIMLSANEAAKLIAHLADWGYSCTEQALNMDRTYYTFEYNKPDQCRKVSLTILRKDTQDGPIFNFILPVKVEILPSPTIDQHLTDITALYAKISKSKDDHVAKVDKDQISRSIASIETDLRVITKAYVSYPKPLEEVLTILRTKFNGSLYSNHMSHGDATDKCYIPGEELVVVSVRGEGSQQYKRCEYLIKSLHDLIKC